MSALPPQPRQPLLTAVFTQCYNESFGYLDHEDDKRERSANKAMLLLSANFNCTDNPYFLEKLREVYQSVEGGEDKWTNDLWFPALVKFAYGGALMGQDDAKKVVNEFNKLWVKNNPDTAAAAVPKITVQDVINLKRGLVYPGIHILVYPEIHICHDAVPRFLAEGFPLVKNLPFDTNLVILSNIVKDVVSKLPHHLSTLVPADPLYVANNYFILKHYKACQLAMYQEKRLLEQQLIILRHHPNPFRDHIMLLVTTHSNIDGILAELGINNLDMSQMYALMKHILDRFMNFVRVRFYARFPTTCLLCGDIDGQLAKFEVDVDDLEAKYRVKDESGSDEENEDGSEGEEDEEDEQAVTPQQAIAPQQAFAPYQIMVPHPAFAPHYQAVAPQQAVASQDIVPQQLAPHQSDIAADADMDAFGLSDDDEDMEGDFEEDEDEDEDEDAETEDEDEDQESDLE